MARNDEQNERDPDGSPPSLPRGAAERLVVAVASVFLATLHVLGFSSVRLDDAFITFRYGENLARGRGFVFNEGERLLGTTSPGHALLAAGVHAIAGHAALPGIMSGLGAVAWTAQALFVFLLFRRPLGLRVASLSALAVAAGVAGSYAYVPLETNLVSMLVLASVVLALRARWVAAGLVLGVAVVVRADAILAAPALLVLAAKDLRQNVAWPALAFVVLPAAWCVFAWRYFGSPWPHTLHAKAYATPMTTYAAHLGRLPLLALSPSAGETSIALFGGVAAWAVAVWGWGRAVNAEPRLAVIPVWALLHLVAYLVLRPNVAFHWHLYPAVLVAMLGALLAVGGVVRRLRTVPAVAVIGAATMAASWGALKFSVEAPDLLWYGARDAIDHEVASFLRVRASPGDVVDAEEVGTLAYATDLRMIDHPGLVTPPPLAAKPGPHLVRDHCRALAALPGLRFLVMSPVEVGPHRCLFGDAPIAVFERPAIDGRWTLAVVDLLAARDGR